MSPRATPFRVPASDMRDIGAVPPKSASWQSAAGRPYMLTGQNYLAEAGRDHARDMFAANENDFTAPETPAYLIGLVGERRTPIAEFIGFQAMNLKEMQVYRASKIRSACADADGSGSRLWTE